MRAAAFVPGLAIPLADERDRPLGPRVVCLAPAHLNLLALYGSPISEGGLATRAQLLQALWILSPGFAVGAPLRFALFRARWWLASHRPAWCARVRTALGHWHRLQFIDRPGTATSADGVAGDPPERWLAGYLLDCSRLLKLPEREALHLPYARTLQYLAELDERRPGAKRPRFNSARDQQAKRYLAAKRRSAGVSRRENVGQTPAAQQGGTGQTTPEARA